MKEISSKRDLEPFVQSLSMYIYENTFTGTIADMEFIELLILGDILEVEDRHESAADF